MGNFNKKRSSLIKQAFLKTFFSESPSYEFKEVNGFILEKRIVKEESEIAIYTKDSWQKKLEYLEKVPVVKVSDEDNKLPF